jgi:hypothetical protein
MARPRRGRSARPLKRKVETREPRKTILVFCEGQRTEPEYLEALRREPVVRDVAAVDLRVHSAGSGAVPFTLVQAAVAAKERAEDEEGEIDEVWCLFDVEWPKNHPRLREARRLATEKGVKLAISNPCFELWLILHFEERSAWLDTETATRERRKHDRSADKGLDASRYMALRSEAARRAVLLERRHEGNGTAFPNDNPSSGMHLLLASIAPASR